VIAPPVALFAPLREIALFRVMNFIGLKREQAAFFRTPGKKQPVPYCDFFFAPLAKSFLIL
jgi:hypothetical protein